MIYKNTLLTKSVQQILNFRQQFCKTTLLYEFFMVLIFSNNAPKLTILALMVYYLHLLKMHKTN